MTQTNAPLARQKRYPHFPTLAPATALFTAIALWPAAALGAEQMQFAVTLEDHRFEPATLVVPANVKIRLSVVNKDETPEEFESNDLHLEKIVAGNKAIALRIGPLAPGTYQFFGDFHGDTAQGTLIVEASE